ncbi:MAG: ATP-binding protein, partial [Leifsonia sp.]
LALTYAGRGGIHPLENVDRDNPRPGLRRWVAVNSATGERSAWREAWMSIHNDGSVTVAAAVGGHRMSSDGYFEGWQVESPAIECAIADLLALMRTTAEATDNDEYDVRLGVEWTGEQPLTILTKDNMGFTYEGVSVPLHRYTPVETTMNAIEPAADFFWHVHDFAQDCVNQGGISNVLMIQPPARDASA